MVDGCKSFSQGAGSELRGRSIPNLSWSGNNNLNVCSLCFNVVLPCDVLDVNLVTRF